MTGTEPMQSDHSHPADGVWGIAEYTKPNMPVHYCMDGRCICTKKGKHRLLRLPLRHWNPDNPRTCPKCKEIYDLLLIEEQGTKLGGKAAGKAAKV